MARKGRTFELAYKHLYDMLDKDIYKITSPAFPIDKTTGKGREVDVLVEYTDSEGKPRRISIECRDQSKVQDITWIEQLIQKKEDLDLDYTIATTTTSFSEGAILKANYHGILIEQAEMPSVETIKTLQQSTFVDFFFFKFDLLECLLFLDGYGFTALREHVKSLNIMEQAALLNEISTKFINSFEPQKLLKEYASSIDFFSAEDNSINLSGSVILNGNKPPCFRKVRAIKFKVNIVPRKISLPICNTFAVFKIEDHSNKKYRADFKNDTDYFSIGYLDNKLMVDFGLKKRRFWRFAGATMHLNTIIPDGTEINVDTCLQCILENHSGEFDLSKLL